MLIMQTKHWSRTSYSMIVQSLYKGRQLLFKSNFFLNPGYLVLVVFPCWHTCLSLIISITYLYILNFNIFVFQLQIAHYCKLLTQKSANILTHSHKIHLFHQFSSLGEIERESLRPWSSTIIVQKGPEKKTYYERM